MFGGAIYTSATKELFPNFEQEAPIERRNIEHNYMILGEEDSTTISYRKDDNASYSVIRGKFDRWMAEEAKKAAKENGVQLDVKQAESSLENQVKQVKDAVKEKYDVILSPAAPTTAPKIGDSLSDPLKMYLGDIYTISVNLAGLPGMTVPCGKDSAGLPIGLQLIGDCFQEKKIIRAGYAFEQSRKYEAPAMTKEGR